MSSLLYARGSTFSLKQCKSIAATAARRRNLLSKNAHAHANHNNIHNVNSNSNRPTFFSKVFSEVKARPIQYASIPAIAAFVGISTNYAGVQMLFYPIEYFGTTGSWSVRYKDIPYGILGWQGVVPARTEKMALRLVDIVTRDLLKLQEVFGRLNHNTLGGLLVDPVMEAVQRDCGSYWAMLLKPFMPLVLKMVVKELQVEIEEVLDLQSVVLNAFVRDKVVLVELFQKVGRVELDFLVKSGFGFGFILGLGQMAVWAVKPKMWTLPVAGALVGYITNWIAIKLLFEPAEPVEFGPFVLQGLFESRQVEVSDEFAHFMESRVLSTPMLLDALANQNEEELFAFLRKQLPWPIPEHVLRAAMEAIRTVASNPKDYEELHEYMQQTMNIEDTLSSRLKKLSAKNFEDLLHPVFQEDEIILIVIGGVLGLGAGAAQTKLGWGGPGANFKAGVMLVTSLALSALFFVASDLEQTMKDQLLKIEEVEKEPEDDRLALGKYDSVIDRVPAKIRRKNSLLRTH